MEGMNSRDRTDAQDYTPELEDRRGAVRGVLQGGHFGGNARTHALHGHLRLLSVSKTLRTQCRKRTWRRSMYDTRMTKHTSSEDAMRNIQNDCVPTTQRIQVAGSGLLYQQVPL
jgi:hypothetical protein